MSQAGDKRAKILLAALELSGGDLMESFTAEELLVSAWKKDPMAFGLRGFEREYPASEVIHREIGRRGPGTQSMVELGLLEQIDRRVYRLTVKGLQRASELAPDESEVRERADREQPNDLVQLIFHHDRQARNLAVGERLRGIRFLISRCATRRSARVRRLPALRRRLDAPVPLFGARQRWRIA